MEAITNHLSEIITIILAIVSAVFTMIKIMNGLRDKLYNERVDNLKEDIKSLKDDLEKLQHRVLNNDDIKRINDTINHLLNTLNEVKHSTLRKEDITRVHLRIDDLSKLLHSTREEIMKETIMDEVEDKNILETVDKLQKAVDICTDCRTCEFSKKDIADRRKVSRDDWSNKDD